MSFSVRRINTKRERRPLRLGRLVLRVLHYAHPLWKWYFVWKKHHEAEEQSGHRIALLKRALFLLVATLCVLVLIAGTVKALIAVQILNVDTIVSVAGAELPKDEHGYTNILLIGQGDENHDGVDLTDTIIVASLDPDRTHSAVLLSIPRDTFFLETAMMGKGKINTFYRDYKAYLHWEKGMTAKDASAEALRELTAEIGRKLGMQIHHVAKVDFIAFVEAVDALDGVDIVVPEDITDTEYPDANYGYQTFSIAAGPQHLDGETALKYVRSRHTTSDFSRSARQQQILAAMAEKAKADKRASDPAFITQMLKTFAERVETTLSIREMISMAELAKSIDRDRIIAMQFNDRNALYDGFVEPGGFLYTPPRDLFGGAAVLLPVSIPEFPVTWKQPQALMTLLMSHRDLYVESPTIAILNSGARSGMARKLATELIRYGFNVGEIANAEIPEKLQNSVIAAAPAAEGMEAADAESFGRMLGIPVGPLPPELPAEQRDDLTIILGEDFSYVPLQDGIPRLQTQ